MEATVSNLRRLTDEFFDLHWNESALSSPPPWSESYNFQGSLPNYNKQGVYAFVKDEEVTYIGVATSRGCGRYRGHGLGKRFMSYAKAMDGYYEPTDPRLANSGSVMTIGFEQEHAYLANALELYLLGRLETEHNQNRPGS